MVTATTITTADCPHAKVAPKALRLWAPPWLAGRLVAGVTADEIATEYPSVTTAELRAAAAYGAAPAKS